jgi:tetratricopeptide (TPR) repeat protein
MSNRFAYLLALGVVLPGAADPGAQPAAEQTGALQFVARDGRQFRAQADGAGAVAAAQGKVLANPQNVDVLIALGDAQASIWDHRAAIETYTKALALAPDRAILYQQRGHRRVSNRDFAGGAADLEKATAMDPALSSAWYYLGLTHYVAGVSPDRGADGGGAAPVRAGGGDVGVAGTRVHCSRAGPGAGEVAARTNRLDTVAPASGDICRRLRVARAPRPRYSLGTPKGGL